MTIFIIILVVAATVIIWKKFSLFPTAIGPEKNFPYKKKDYFFSIAENNFYQTLKIIAEQNNALLFAKVRLEDILWIPRGAGNRFGLRNRIKSRHVDFLLCDKPDARPIIAVELDDSSHNAAERIERDDFINKVFQDANLPYLRVRAQQSYNAGELTEEIKKKISGNNYERKN